MKFKDLLQQDKALHFGVCLAASIAHPVFALGLAIGKEYGDSQAENNKWDWVDILADLIGIVVGSIIHIILVKCIL